MRLGERLGHRGHHSEPPTCGGRRARAHGARALQRRHRAEQVEQLAVRVVQRQRCRVHAHRRVAARCPPCGAARRPSNSADPPAPDRAAAPGSASATRPFPRPSPASARRSRTPATAAALRSAAATATAARLLHSRPSNARTDSDRSAAGAPFSRNSSTHIRRSHSSDLRGRFKQRTHRDHLVVEARWAAGMLLDQPRREVPLPVPRHRQLHRAVLRRHLLAVAGCCGGCRTPAPPPAR